MTANRRKVGLHSLMQVDENIYRDGDGCEDGERFFTGTDYHA